MQCMLIGQTHTKHWLPGIFKKPCKNIYSTNMENSDNSIYLFVCSIVKAPIETDAKEQAHHTKDKRIVCLHVTSLLFSCLWYGVQSVEEKFT